MAGVTTGLSLHQEAGRRSERVTRADAAVQVNGDAGASALDIELHQLLETTELTFDANGRQPRVLDGEIWRSERLSPLAL